MRAIITSPLRAACSAALLVPLFLSAGGPASAADASAPDAPSATAGGIQSLALEPLETGERSGGAGSGADAMGLPATETERFSLLGVVWTNAAEHLAGEARVRARSAETGEWSPWYELGSYAEHAPDPGSAEAASLDLHGGTAPLWVGISDAVQVRVWPEGGAADGSGAPDPVGALPEGLRLELVDPGPDGTGQVTGADDAPGTDDPGADDPGADGAGAGPLADTAQAADLAEAAEAALTAEAATAAEAAQAAQAADHVGPRPPVVTRAGWGADESLREREFAYTDSVKTAFVHHTAGANNYACSEAPALIRGIYRYHVESLGWRDLGYNFLIDRCGTIYEGRAGGVDRAVMGAHTLGFNHNSMGAAVLGTYSDTSPTKEVLDAIAQLTAWKLGLYGNDPLGSRNRVSSGGSHAAGTIVRMNNISGHRDGYATDCPGGRLYDQLPAIRTAAAKLQGR